MRLFDTMSGSIRELEVRPRMSLYVCGITPYDSAHVGHAFTYLSFDVLARYLRHLGADVDHAQNVTDVDDDILRVARERGEDYLALGEREVRSFQAAMDGLGIVRPALEPRPTRFMPEIVDDVTALLASGHAYRRDGAVYFSVATDPGYGRLSKLDGNAMVALAAERGGNPDDPAKDDPLDFVLWQPSAPDEPSWDSPWGSGRPGWHIECSTMSRRVLGQPVDVHGGGADLVYPHHESEIAQAEGVPGPRPFVRHWMHTGLVGMTGEKMSKSLGNLAFVGELLRTYDAQAVRRFLLRRHYRSEWEFEEDALKAEQAASEAEPRSRPVADGPEGVPAFLAAMEEDLDTPSAVGVLERAEAGARADREDVLRLGRDVLGLTAARGG